MDLTSLKQKRTQRIHYPQHNDTQQCVMRTEDGSFAQKWGKSLEYFCSIRDRILPNTMRYLSSYRHILRLGKTNLASGYPCVNESSVSQFIITPYTT
jgi:hypothetical protein